MKAQRRFILGHDKPLIFAFSGTITPLLIIRRSFLVDNVRGPSRHFLGTGECDPSALADCKCRTVVALLTNGWCITLARAVREYVMPIVHYNIYDLNLR